jgi:hypothetical protein
VSEHRDINVPNTSLARAGSRSLSNIASSSLNSWLGNLLDRYFAPALFEDQAGNLTTFVLLNRERCLHDFRRKPYFTFWKDLIESGNLRRKTFPSTRDVAAGTAFVGRLVQRASTAYGDAGKRSTR